VKYRFIWLVILGTLVQLSAFAQNKSNRGKEFWLGYGYNYKFFNEPPLNDQELAIYISTTNQAATVTVSITNTTFSQVLTIPANTTDASILIPKTGANDARIITDGLHNRAIHIESDVPVAAYAHVYGTMVSGATMLMPAESYGYTYRSVNYTQTTSGTQLPATPVTTQNGPDWYSWFYVVAGEDNTRLEITPSDTTKNGWLPTQTYTINLNKGQIYAVFGKLVNGNNALWAASKDMSGSKVTSIIGADGNCHPFALFSGSSGLRVCRGDGGEFVQQQMFPLQAWGTKYATYHTVNNTTTDILETNRNYYRINVNDPTTVVKRNGTVLTGLINNFYYQYMDSLGGDVIEADKPILLSQYMVNENQCWALNGGGMVGGYSLGDPEMFYVSPLRQGQKLINFFTPRKQSIDFVYANIILPTPGVSSLLVDGMSLPSTQIIAHPNLAGYSVALARFMGPAAPHQISCDSNVIATVYGLGNFESYGFNAGCNINNLNNILQIKNTQSANTADTVTCNKTPFRIFAKLGYQANSITYKLSAVTGLTPNADSIITTPTPIATELIDGRTFYVYTLQQDFSFATPGTYKIPISYTTPEVPNCNQTNYDTLLVIVKPGPIANFNFTSPACGTDTLFFTNTSNPAGFTIINNLWNFDDASSQATINAKKRFNTGGSQNVRLRIYANTGCVGDTTIPVNINYNPLSKFGIASTACPGDSVLITDTSTVTSSTITQWQWLFGDGNTTIRTNGLPFKYAYNSSGSFIIKLITTSATGCKSDTAFKNITINPKPIAKFGFDKNICLGDSIRVSDSSQIASGLLTSWNWNMGDGTSLVKTSNTPFFYKYNITGNYTIKLVVTSANGCISDTFSLPILVTNKPMVDFTITGKPCVDSTIIFTNNNAIAGTTSYWDLGGVVSIGTANTINNIYTGSLTNIIIKHVLVVGPGCVSDTVNKVIPQIFANPTVSISINPAAICEGSQININGNSNGTTWQWNFGNGSGNNTPPFTRTYNTAGNYTITARAANGVGCLSPVQTQMLLVNPRPVVNAGADITINLGANTLINSSVSPLGAYTYTWTPASFLSNANILQPVASPTQTTTYTLTATSSQGCSQTDAVKIEVFDGLKIPNSFTPNNDGLNDSWQVLGLGIYPQAQLIIYDRWGKALFTTTGLQNKPWNAVYKAQKLASGSYVYYIKLNNGTDKVINGTVTVIR
jgi:gliding motility-associated-like protein